MFCLTTDRFNNPNRKHQSYKETLKINNFNLNCFDIDIAIETAEEAIALAEKKLGNAKHLATYNAYISLAYETSYEDVEGAIKHFSFILNVYCYSKTMNCRNLLLVYFWVLK